LERRGASVRALPFVRTRACLCALLQLAEFCARASFLSPILVPSGSGLDPCTK
jgi:hypothetical protein